MSINFFNYMAKAIIDPKGTYDQMLKTNPKFADFVKQNEGKSNEEIAKNYGLDPSVITMLNNFAKLKK